MEITPYRNHVPHEWLIKGSFLDRNPNMSYLVSSGSQNTPGILIDASGALDRIIHDLAPKPSTLEYILITHNHGDHTFTLPELIRNFPEARIGIHPSSIQALSSQGFSHLFPLEDGMVITTGDEALVVIHTPGHTADSVSFWNREGNLFFSGDTLFGGGIGCSDYNAGGNRNIFYQTIINLLEILTSHTHLYPGHYSEHYQTLPPYNLATEKVKNPYIFNAMHGKRGDFDRDLKAFSIDFEVNNYAMMNESEIDKIWALEKEIWIPELQASKDTILTRLRRGHKLLVMKGHDEFLGMVGWCYSRFSISDPPEDFPVKFSKFSTCKSCNKTEAQSAFIYNVGVKPTCRRKGAGSLLLQWACEKIRADGISQVFIDSRLPSYNGSQQHHHENIQQNPEFRESIDRYFAKNQFPSNREFILEPRIRFYMRNSFRPWLILKDFILDKPSGNMRVICYLNLQQDDFGYRKGNS